MYNKYIIWLKHNKLLGLFGLWSTVRAVASPLQEIIALESPELATYNILSSVTKADTAVQPAGFWMILGSIFIYTFKVYIKFKS